ncbi:unnamed protein product [Symbiodinium microadriaticum]|nr:unnamed protein product [Symbiodinium microadriaticum]
MTDADHGAQEIGRALREQGRQVPERYAQLQASLDQARPVSVDGRGLSAATEDQTRAEQGWAILTSGALHRHRQGRARAMLRGIFKDGKKGRKEAAEHEEVRQKRLETVCDWWSLLSAGLLRRCYLVLLALCGLSLARACTAFIGSRRPNATTSLQRAAEAEVATKPPKGNWFEETKAFWDDLEVFMPLDEDTAPEAKALLNQTEKVERMTAEQEAVLAKKSYLRGKSDEALGEELNKLQSLSYEYWKMRVYRVFSKESVKEGFVSFLTYGNAIFILIFLRTVVPRISSLDDFFGFANEIGDVIRNISSYDTLFKALIYTVAFIVEKLTLISEILPVQVALKTMSPVVFGGLIPGALISATCETVGATVNFFIGRTFFFQRGLAELLHGVFVFRGFRLERAAEKEGLKMTLLLRLSHILPVPFDSYWYILGALPVGVPEFIVAHWVGCLKTAFLDASLGLLLLTSVVNLEEGAEKSNIIVAESVGFALVALLVQTFATGLVKDILGLEDEKKPDATKATPPLKDQAFPFKRLC